MNGGGSIAAVSIAVLLGAARWVPRFRVHDSLLQVPSDLWHTASLPTTPVLLHDSPQHRWWVVHGVTWDVAHVKTLAATTEAGEYNVTLQWQTHGPLFMPYTSGATEPEFSRGVVQLRAAAARLWPVTPERKDITHYYLSASVEDLPPSIAASVLEFLPQGCVRDERWESGAAATPSVWADDQVVDAYCRGLTANMWFGAAGTSAQTHFDLSHNLFFLAAGSKRFKLLPPSAHRQLMLHPCWHGSHLAAQAHPSDEEWAAMGGYEVTLHAGELLYLPPGWFHHVSSTSANIGVNIWTHSLATDAWHHLCVLTPLPNPNPSPSSNARPCPHPLATDAWHQLCCSLSIPLALPCLHLP